jgi:nucleoside-diphosphate-sugar epimerase
MPSLPERRVLITGATGFIGGLACRRAAESGASVVGVSRRPAPDPMGDVSWRQADLTDPEAARALVREVAPQAIIHLASEVSGARDLDRVVPMLRANLLAAVNVMDGAAREPGCRVVLAGSMEEPQLDAETTVPQSPYAAAKWAAAGYARLFSAVYGLAVVHLRLFMVYGPGQPDRNKLVPYVTDSLLRGEAPKLMSGRREIDWIYVEDVVDALLAAATAEGVAGRSLDVGSGRLVSVRDVVEKLAHMVGGDVDPIFGGVPDRELERVAVADVAPTTAALGWRPQVDLDEGLARTVAYRRAELGGRDLASALGSRAPVRG